MCLPYLKVPECHVYHVEDEVLPFGGQFLHLQYTVERPPPLLVFRKNKNAAWHTHAVVVCFHQQPAHPINLEDAVANSGYGTDITNQQSGNYAYDPIGNMVHDEQGKINTVSWTVYGKIDHLTKKDGSTVQYTYDASGNRISKNAKGVETWYVRDATGNMMATYTKGDIAINSGNLTQAEVDLYGSSRLGLLNTSVNCSNNGNGPTALGNAWDATYNRGQKLFELTNHLGNVLATVTDRLVPVPDASNTFIDHNLPDVASANDYYAFGMAMPGRSFSAGTQYRYGFNGKENDRDISDGAQDYGMRINDVRLGKFLSVDPLQTKFAFLSPFAFAANSPLRCTDMDGLEPQDYMKFWAKYPSTYLGQWGQDVGNVYDNVTNKVWTVMNYPNQDKVFYWKPYDGSNGTFDYAHSGAGNKDKQGNWTGVWQAFETRDAWEAKKNLTDQSVAAVTVLPIVAVPGAAVVGFELTEAAYGWLGDYAYGVSIKATSFVLRNWKLYTTAFTIVQGMGDPSPTGGTGGLGIIETQVEIKVAESLECKAGFSCRQGNAIDPGLDNFISDLESKGITVLGKNLEIIENATGKIAGEVDVLTTNAAIQYKNGASGAAQMINQIVNKTEPFINKAVVGFVNGANATKGAIRTVKEAGSHIMVTNDINKLVELIK